MLLDSTPFYAEGGGQVGDQGELKLSRLYLKFLMSGKLGILLLRILERCNSGMFRIGDKVIATVNEGSRSRTAANHSATHLLHAALNTILGDHVEQKGSLVDSSRLRFDFAHNEAVTSDEVIRIEQMVNTQILANHTVDTQVMAIEDAKKAGAAALFGEKYGEKVRVVGMSAFSLELCGGYSCYSYR